MIIAKLLYSSGCFLAVDHVRLNLGGGGDNLGHLLGDGNYQISLFISFWKIWVVFPALASSNNGSWDGFTSFANHILKQLLYYVCNVVI